MEFELALGGAMGKPYHHPTLVMSLKLNREALARCCKLRSIGTMVMRGVLKSDN